LLTGWCGVIELGAQLSLVDHLGEAHMPAALITEKVTRWSG